MQIIHGKKICFSGLGLTDITNYIAANINWIPFLVDTRKKAINIFISDIITLLCGQFDAEHLFYRVCVEINFCFALCAKNFIHLACGKVTICKLLKGSNHFETDHKYAIKSRLSVCVCQAPNNFTEKSRCRYAAVLSKS